ncbi:MAG: DUF2279 domain-containing protein [Bacteroidia bacterium]
MPRKLSITISLIGFLYAQSDSLSRKKLFYGTVAAYAATYSGLALSWYDWKQVQGWRFFDDGAQWKQMDKLGHAWSAYQLARVYYELCRQAAYTDKQATRRALWVSASFQNSIELWDGFFPSYGASVWDIVANTAGISLWYLDKKIPAVNIELRFSFWPSPYAAQRPELLGRGISQILKDYNGQTYWLTLSRNPFPIALSLGYRASGLLGGYGKIPWEMLRAREKRHYYLSFDVNWRCFTPKKRFWRYVLFCLEALKLPAPALEYVQGTWILRPVQY